MPSNKGKSQPVGVGMTPSKSELGNYIRTRRIELDLRQVPLANKCGFAQNFVSQLEIGIRKYLNSKQLERLAKALQCDVEELRKRMSVKPIAQPTTELGKLIRSRREELGLSLKAFAKKMKIKPQKAKLLEIRKSPTIRYDSLKPLANALELDPTTLGRFVGTTRKETKSELGQLVRTRRKELGMSIKHLAEKLNVSRQFVNQIEFGQCRLSENDETIEKLAQALEIDINKLEELRPERRLKRMQTENADPLGGFLAAKRLELRLTQREVSERAEVSSGIISGIETGNMHPGLGTLERVAKALNCQIPPELIPPPSEHSNNGHKEPGFTIERETPLGKFITTRRLELKLSQAEVALRAEMATGVVSGIERGVYRASGDVIERISKALECQIPPEIIPPPNEQEGGKGPGYTVERESPLGKFLTTRRLELQLNQAEVAHKANTSPAVVSGVERGTYRPGRQILEKLSKALECEIPAELIPEPRKYGSRVSNRTSEDPPSSVMVHLSDQNLADLEKIKELSDIRANPEAVRKALKILRRLLEKQADGHAVCLRKDGNVVELEFLF